MHISLIAILVGAVVSGCLYWLGAWILGLLSPAEPFGRIARIALALVCVLLFIGFAIGHIAIPTIGL
jgi:hypothetical protein